FCELPAQPVIPAAQDDISRFERIASPIVAVGDDRVWKSQRLQRIPRGAETVWRNITSKSLELLKRTSGNSTVS
ncbi:MAG: hypothetical protein QXU21_07565, partial [Candidatus Bathyarchaeia archaeon]